MLSAAILYSLGIVPYSWLPAMDGYPDPATTQQVESGQQFSAILKSKDEDTYINEINSQTSVQPSVSHVILVCSDHSGLNSGTTESMSGGYNNGLYTLNHTINALTLGIGLQYYDTVDFYKAVDNNSSTVIKDAEVHFSHSVRIWNPSYEPPGEGG